MRRVSRDFPVSKYDEISHSCYDRSGLIGTEFGVGSSEFGVQRSELGSQSFVLKWVYSRDAEIPGDVVDASGSCAVGGEPRLPNPLVTCPRATAIKNKMFHAAHPVYRADLSAGAPRKRAKETSPYLGIVCATRG